MSFNQLQIVANTTVLDTYDDWDISLNYKIQDITDISKRETSFSKTIIIPGTKINNEFFENIFDLNVDISITSYMETNRYLMETYNCFKSFKIKK